MINPIPYDATVMPAAKPIVDELQTLEVVFAADQPQYHPLRAIKSRNENGEVLTRWSFSAEQRRAIAEGADLFLVLQTHNSPLQPMKLIVADRLEYSSVVQAFELDPLTVLKVKE